MCTRRRRTIECEESRLHHCGSGVRIVSVGRGVRPANARRVGSRNGKNIGDEGPLLIKPRSAVEGAVDTARSVVQENAALRVVERFRP